MFRCAWTLALLAIFASRGDAKYKNYSHVLTSPEYKEMMNLFAPEKMLTNYNNILAVREGDKAWLNSSCRRDLIILNDAITRRELWALTMLDASSMLSSGLLRGNFVDLGQYDECLTAQNDRSDEGIRGRHCMYSFSASRENITLPVNPTLSICLPATCAANDIVAFFNATMFSQINKLKDLQVKIASATCSSPVNSPVWDPEFVVCLTVLAGLVAFLIACTAMEIINSRLDTGQRRHPIISTLAKFSLRRSASSILNMEVKEGSLPVIYGIRSISMVLVVLFHEYNLFSPTGVTINTLDFLEWTHTWQSFYIFIAQFAVDSFFVVSSFLMTYLFLKNMPKQHKFNLPMYYLHRYLRLTPAVLALMVFTIAFVPKLESGTHWNAPMKYYIDSCRNKWWPALLFIQNFVNKENYCLQHLWYLAVDMQLFWISPLILYPLYRKPKFGLVVLAVFFLSSLAIPASVIGIRKLPVMSFRHEANATVRRTIFMDITESPFHRAAPWFVGIFLGYEVAMNDRLLNRWIVGTGWLITIASFAFCTFGVRSFFDPNYEYNAIWETFFSAFSRPIWAIGISWIIYASIKNQAGFLSNILSCRIFIPLSKLSYCAYLIHFVLQISHNAALKAPTYFSEYYLWRSFLTTLTTSIAAAFLFNLFFESPILVLETMLKKKNKRIVSTTGKSRNELELQCRRETES